MNNKNPAFTIKRNIKQRTDNTYTHAKRMTTNFKSALFFKGNGSFVFIGLLLKDLHRYWSNIKHRSRVIYTVYIIRVSKLMFLLIIKVRHVVSEYLKIQHCKL